MSYTMSYDFRADNNTNGKRFGGIRGVCLHHSAGTTLNLVPTFLDNETSAHYGIKDHLVRQFLEDNDTAWATGTTEGNNAWVSIECVNSSTGGTWPVSDTTVDTLCQFLADKAGDWGIHEYVAGVNLKGHRDFSPTLCPGALYEQMFDIAERANELMRPKGWDEMATMEEIKQACFEAARDAVWEQRGNIADAVFAKDVEGKPYYWRAQQGSDAAFYANEALHVGDPTGRCDMPPLEQLRYMAAKQADIIERMDVLAMQLNVIVETVTQLKSERNDG